MNSMLYIILLFILPITLVYSRGTIAEDNFELQLDKTAHLGVSYGLYFTFYTLYSDSLLFTLSDSIPIELHSMLSATLVGLSYECYQSTPISRSDGFSLHDITYNVIGIGLARLTHEFFLYFKEIL